MSIVTKSLAVTWLILVSVSTAQAKQDKPRDYFIPDSALSAPVRQHILQDRFVTVKTVQAIPKSVLNLLLGKDPLDGMADFGKPFQMTDVISGPEHLPFRRLIFAAVSEEYCLVYNEYGGIGYGTEVSVYRLATGNAALVWKASLMGEKNFLSLPQLQSKIREGKFYKIVRKDHD